MPEQSIICGVYVIENTVNGMCYVGSSRNVPMRWKGHLSLLRAGRHTNIHLQRSWQKYGADAFVFRVVVETTESDRRTVEAETMRRYLPSELYNQMTPPDGQRGLLHAPSTKQLMREIALGRTLSDETRRKIGDVQRGLPKGPRSGETRRKISVTLQGHSFSDDTRAKMRAAKLGKPHPHSPEARRKMSESQKGRAGHTQTDETRAKIAEASRSMWQKRRKGRI